MVTTAWALLALVKVSPERYREAIQRQEVDGDPVRLSAIKRQTATSDAIKKLLGQPARSIAAGSNPF